MSETAGVARALSTRPFECLTRSLQTDARVGIDPVEDVRLVENHDEALEHWRAAGVRGGTVVHIDAHHDIARIPHGGQITIANYIRAAVDEGLVAEVFWIVPDPSWEDARARQPIMRHLRRLSEGTPVVAGPRGNPSSISVPLSGGRALTVCPFPSLPRLREPVLLDIDVDYFLIPRVSYASSDRHAAVPWCWPGDLVGRLRGLDIRTRLVTIAYSVEGGYTPLRWKYLGDELRGHLRCPAAVSSATGWARHMRDGAVAADSNNLDAAAWSFRQARDAFGESAAPDFHLAEAQLAAGRVDDARVALRRAHTIDPSYRTPYGTAGMMLMRQGRVAAAAREYDRALRLDPADAFARAGLGWIAARRQRWSEAERLLRESLALNPSQLDVHRLLGDVYAKRRRWADAADSYERSLTLALSGGRSLDAPITGLPRRMLADPEHGRTHARLGRARAREGEVAGAISSLRIGIAAGLNGAGVRVQLAGLRFRQREWRQSRDELLTALSRMPQEVWCLIGKSAMRARLAMSGRRPLVAPFSLD